MAEGVIQFVIEHFGSGLEEQVSAFRLPLHLLFLHETLADDLIVSSAMESTEFAWVATVDALEFSIEVGTRKETTQLVDFADALLDFAEHGGCLVNSLLVDPLRDVHAATSIDRSAQFLNRNAETPCQPSDRQIRISMNRRLFDQLFEPPHQSLVI